MRFTYLESMIDPDFYLPLGVAAEEAGWDSFAIPDSIGYPEVSDSEYPYTPDGSREFLEDKPFLEPFSLIPAMGAVTSRLRFTTFVMKLPVRHPVLVAKSASSVARLTKNRFGFGIGLSPWPEDFRICGQEWKGRGRRMDEMIEIIRGLTAGGFFSFAGEFYDIESIKLSPTPTQKLPILIGGHSEAALRRAARLGDGWMHAGGDPQELDQMLGKLANYRRECAREREPFEIHVISEDVHTLDGVRRLEDKGITDLLVGFRDPYTMGPDPEKLEDKIGALRAYADDVIAKL